MTTTATKTRTITLTDRRPVKITDNEWPIIASGSHSRHDGQVEVQANRKWCGWLKVRQHQDGRAIVYGRDDHDTLWQGERGHCYRGGEVLEVGADIPAAIRRVAQELVDRGANIEMIAVAHECIANLPAEEL